MHSTVLGLGSRCLEGAEKTPGGTLMGRRLWMMLKVRTMLLEDGEKVTVRH